MTNTPTPVKPDKSFAFLKNVMGCMTLVNKICHGRPNLPSIGVVNGFSGYGKSQGAIYAQMKTRAILVEVGATWTRKTLLENILKEGGVHKPRGTIASLADQCIMMLGDNPERPLFIDEADKLVDRDMLEVTRELHDKSGVPLLLIGEETLPKKLAAVERFHNRVLDWYPAQPLDLEDCRKLAVIFLEKFEIDDALLELVRKAGDGRARRIVTCLDNMAEWARNNGLRQLDPRSYRGGFVTGDHPQVRSERQSKAAVRAA